jgi:tetratricopeptide (TPR) repeat protein
MLGYGYLNLGDNAQAIEALKKYASLLPNEPNPHDSLGEAMMAAGDLAGAEAEFKQALTISPNFHIAHEGVAYTKFFRGDWTGGKEALAAARTAAARPVDRATTDTLSGVALLAEGKAADATKAFNTLVNSPDASIVQQSQVPAFRAMMMIDTGRYPDAIKEADKAIALANDGKFPKGAAPGLRRSGLVATAVAGGLSADAASVQKAVAALQKEAADRPGDPFAQSAMHLALGMQSVAAKDLKAAAGHFEQCSKNDSYCHVAAFMASKKAGDRPGMDAARARLARSYLRDPIYLYSRTVVERGQPKPKQS